MKLTDKSMVDLREIVRHDPVRRAAAWAEIAYRNRFRQDFELINGRPPRAPKVEPWLLPNLSPPTSIGDGPLT